MSLRLAPRRSSGNTTHALRIWAMLFLVAGIIGRTVLQLRFLNVTGLMTYEEVEKIIEASEDKTIVALIAAVIDLLKTCAVPLFAFLLVEGVRHTSSFRNYFLRVAGLALVTEIPYDLAMYNFTVNGQLFNWQDQNPVLGVALAMVMLYLLKHYGGKKLKNILISIVVVVFALVWAWMLKISEGGPMILLVAAFWLFRGKQNLQVFVGAVACCLCVGFGLDYIRYLFSPVVLLMIFRYNGEPGEDNRLLNYAAYPAILLAVWFAANYLI